MARGAARLRDADGPGGLMSEGAAGLGRTARGWWHATTETVRAHPVAFALTAGGIAWLVVARARSGSLASSLARPEVEDVSRWEDDGGPVPETPAAWMIEADALRHKAASEYDRIAAARKAGKTPTADLDRERRDVLSSLTRDVRRAMERGLDGLGQAAREAAIKAREVAYVARINAAQAGSEVLGARPLTTSAVLAVAGAALAYLVPQSAGEVRLMRGMADRAIRFAKDLLEDESGRMSGVAASLSDALGDNLRRMHEQIDEAARQMVSPAPSPAPDDRAP